MFFQWLGRFSLRTGTAKTTWKWRINGVLCPVMERLSHPVRYFLAQFAFYRMPIYGRAIKSIHGWRQKALRTKIDHLLFIAEQKCNPFVWWLWEKITIYSWEIPRNFRTLTYADVNPLLLCKTIYFINQIRYDNTEGEFNYTFKKLFPINWQNEWYYLNLYHLKQLKRALFYRKYNSFAMDFQCCWYEITGNVNYDGKSRSRDPTMSCDCLMTWLSLV